MFLEKRKDAYCGLYCGACPITNCEGCKSENIPDFCSICKFRPCAQSREVELCAQCPDYPCEICHEFNHDQWMHHRTIFSNAEYILKYGLEAWLTQQDQRWRCPNCKEPFTWYDEWCVHCGSVVEGVDPPQKSGTKKEENN